MAEPFDLADADETDETDVGTENGSFAELRKAFKRSERQRKALETELEPLREFKSSVELEQRQGKISTVFSEVGLSPKHALLFEKMNPEAEVTPEAVKSFAAEFELVTQAGDSVSKPETPSGFTPITSGTPPGATELTNEDLKKMLSEGRGAEVQKAFESGRVESVDVPWVQATR